jgi:AmpE protein
MTLLTVLLGLLVNHHWRSERQLPVDAWLPEFQGWLLRNAHRLPEPVRQWPLTLALLAIVPPLVLLAALLWLTSGAVFGIVSLGIHVLVLLYCFARLNQQDEVEHYAALWQHGNYEAAYLYISEHAPDAFSPGLQDYGLMHQQFLAYLQVQAFRNLFAVLFWYIVLGPLGALCYWLCVQVRRSGLLLQEDDAGRQADLVLAALEWLPARLLALSYALAGHFVESFAELRERIARGLDVQENLELLQAAAEQAAGLAGLHSAGVTDRVTGSLKSLQDLMVRAQVVWVIVLALAILVV